MKKLIPNKRQLKREIYDQLASLLQQGIAMDELRHLVDHQPEGMDQAEYLDKVGQAGRHMRDLQAQVMRLRNQARTIGAKNLDAAAANILLVCSLHQESASNNIAPAEHFLATHLAEERT